MAKPMMKMIRRRGAEASVNLSKRRDWFLDVTQTPANVVKSSGADIGVSGAETIVAGNVCYRDSSDQAALAQADVVATAGAFGFALGGGGADQPIRFQTEGVINIGATLTLGETYVVSAANPGKVAPIGDLASTNSPTILGVAISTSLLQLSINVSGILHA